VFLCKHADVHLKAAALKGQQNCWLFMFLVSLFVWSLLTLFLCKFFTCVEGTGIRELAKGDGESTKHEIN